MKDNIVGVRELRENLQSFVNEIRRGKSFIVLRKSKPLFKISPYDEESDLWEEVIDFTKIKKGGVRAEKLHPHLMGNVLFLAVARRNEKTYKS